MAKVPTSPGTITFSDSRYVFLLGNITLADIYTVVPYANNIDVVTMKGSTIKSMLEHSVSDYDPFHPDPRGWFLQVSGNWRTLITFSNLTSFRTFGVEGPLSPNG